MTNSHHLDPGKPLEMMDVVTLLMKNCGQNVNAERAHTNEKFHLERVHVNEKIDQIISGVTDNLTSMAKSLTTRSNDLNEKIADVELNLETVSLYQNQLLLNLKVGIQDTLQRIHHDVRSELATFVTAVSTPRQTYSII